MDSKRNHSSNEDYSDSGENFLGPKDNRLMDDNDRVLRINPSTISLNPPPPPLPGVFIFDRPNQQGQPPQNIDTNCNVSTEAYNHCTNIRNLPSPGYLVPFSKTQSGQVANDNIHKSSNIYSTSSNNLPLPLQLQPTVSENSDSEIHHLQSLEPITPSTLEESFQSSDNKVYHQLNVISPNHYKQQAEPKLYHEMGPVSLPMSTLPREDYVQKNYQPLKPVLVAEDPQKRNKKFQELKPLIPPHFDAPQYVNSKLYQQLCQPLMKNERPKFQPESKNYQQLRPVPVIDFEQSRNQNILQTTQQHLTKIPVSVYPTSTTSEIGTIQGRPFRDSVINKADSQIGRPIILDKKNNNPANLQGMNIKEPYISFKEDKPKVYLELRNPSIRSQLPKSSPHKGDTPSKYENMQVSTTIHTSLSQLHKTQKPEFKLPGPCEFNLPEQKSPNKYKLPKLLGHNEYRSPELNLNLIEKRHENNTIPSFGDLKKISTSVLPLPSTSTKTSFNGIRNKVPLSLPKTPLCYGDPGVSNKVSYYTDNNIVSCGNSESTRIQSSLACFEKQTEIKVLDPNPSYTTSTSNHSKLREELLKPKTMVNKFVGIVLEEDAHKGFSPKDSQSINAKDQDNIKIKPSPEKRELFKSPSKFTIPYEPSKSNLNQKGIENLSINIGRPKQYKKLVSENVTFPELNVNKVSEIRGLDNIKNVETNEADSVSHFNLSNDKVQIKEKGNATSFESTHCLRLESNQSSSPEKSETSKLTVSSTAVADSCKRDCTFTLLTKDSGEKISDQNTVPIIKQPCKLRNSEDESKNIIEDVSISGKKPLESEFHIVKEDTCKGENDNTNNVKELCSNGINKLPVDKVSEKVALENDISVDVSDEQMVQSSSTHVVTQQQNNSTLTNCGKDNNISIKSMSSSTLELKQECSKEPETKVKRKYTRRIVPEVQRRMHIKRKASWGVKDVVAREKRRYKKRNTLKIPKSEECVTSNQNEVWSDNESLVKETPEVKIEALSEDEEIKNDRLVTVQLQDSSPRKKRKYTKRKTKFEHSEERTRSYNNKSVKKKTFKQDVCKENQQERNLKSSTDVKHKFVDPLEEGLISDDDGEVVFIGFDMTDEEDCLLGFEMESDVEPENDLQLQFLAKLQEADCVTVECDPRSLLKPAPDTVSCSQCNKRFHSHMDLVMHMQSHTTGHTTTYTHSYECTVCFRSFNSQVQLDRHVKWTHKGGKKYKCTKCPKMFTTRAYAKRHAETAHKEEEIKVTTFYCGECSATFKTETDLRKHDNKVHKKILHQCEKCLKYFEKLSNLQRHILSHNEDSEPQAFPCAYCNQKFSSRESLHAHWPIHTEKKVYTCDICNNNFTALNSLKRHRILHGGEKLFRCEICQRSFSLLSTLKTHLLIHTGARRFECKLCGKKFNRRDVLNAHQWVHTGEKRFQCDVCFAKFRWRHAVRSHKLIYHSTEKPYACQICGKRFSHPDSFKKHAEVHAERLFYCQICLKAFSRASTLKVHITTHTDLKPFFCDKCHKGFRSKSHLRNHFLVHTKEKPWLCKFCNKTYKDRTQLRRHKIVVHCKAFYKKISYNVPEIQNTEENLQLMDSQPSEYTTQLDHFKDTIDADPSKHLISSPVESGFVKVEETVVPPSVF